MGNVIPLTSALVMGLFLLVVVIAITRNERWRIYDGPGGNASRSRPDALADYVAEWIQHPWSWTLVFVFLTVGFAFSALLYVGGGPAPEASRGIAGVVIAGFLLILVGSFLFIGMYITAKSRGRSNAWGVAEGVFALGVVFMGAIVVNLLIS